MRGLTKTNLLKLFGMLSRDYLVLVLCASLVAWPVAYWLAVGWMDNFAYKVEIRWTVFVMALMFNLLTAITAVGFRTMTIAATNPIDALRHR